MNVHPASVSLKPPKGAPKVAEIHIRPAKNGLIAAHYGPPGSPTHFRPAEYTFHGPKAVSGLLNHITKHARNLWLGGKTMEPRQPGAAKAHRMQQLTTSGY